MALFSIFYQEISTSQNHSQTSLFVHTNKNIVDKCESKYCGCLHYSANALPRTMTRMADEAFAKLGLTSSYAFLLMTAIEQPGIQPKEICQHLDLTPSTVTRLIEKLEYKDLMERRKEGRATKVYPTSAGLKMQAEIKRAWDELYTRYSSILGIKNSK